MKTSSFLNLILAASLSHPGFAHAFCGEIPRQTSPNEKGEALVKNLESQFEKVFSSTGFVSYKAFEASLRSSADPMTKKALQLIDKDAIKVAMVRTETNRDRFSKTGFLNQFVAQTSSAMLSAKMRNLSERNFYRICSLADYENLDPYVKPKYATFVVDPDSGASSDFGALEQYGSDLYYFKTKNIQSRMTFYPTDSIGVAGYRPDPVVEQGLTWNFHFVPWSRRLLMVPYMLKELEQNKFSGRLWPEQRIVHEAPSEFFAPAYWEVQIAGILTLDDVEKFVFRENPPSGEFLNDLTVRKIKIYDGRHEPATEWRAK